CHPDTRTAMLEDLHEWSSRTDFGSSILWLHGPAGAGKSAIAQSFCEMLKAEARLGASFFFKRGDASRGSGSRLFSAIAYQLARSLPDLKQAISAIVEDDPSIVDTDLSTQVLKLIIEPCRFNTPTCNLVVVVIDGLDECEGHHIQREILRLLGTVVCTQPLPFRILVASRPEPHIQEVFHNALNEIHRPLNINQSFEDVQTYLVDEFRRIHREHWETMALVGEPWPPSNVIEKLADKSSGYFVYPSLVVRFIDDRDFRPTERLDVIMGLRETKTEAPFAALDQLYIEILSTVPASSHQRLIEILAVLAAKFNLSIFHIEQLLDMETGDARLILRRLQSVLDVPQNIGERLKVHHASFLDFLEDPTRSGLFYIGDSQRMNLARHILKALSFAVSGENSHVAWQFDQVEFEYVMSIQPTPALVSDLCSLNHNFLIFPSVHHVIRRVLSWLRVSQMVPPVDAYCRLAETDPTVFRAVAWSLYNLGLYLSMAGQYEAAARADKEAFACCLHNLAVHLSHVGQYEAAVCATEEAVHLRRKLAETNSFIITELASSLHNLGFQLNQSGQYEAAARAAEEAVHLRRKLAETDPTVTKDLTWSLHNFAIDLHNTGQYEAAVRADKESVELCRKLTETDPFVTDRFACCLHHLGFALSQTGQYEAAVCATEEAVHLRRKLAETNSFIITELASSLHNLGFQLSQSGQYEAAARAAEEAVHLRRELAETDPTVTKDLAWSLHNFAIDLHNTGQYEAAVRADKEAVEICRKLTEIAPFGADDLAWLLHSLGFHLSQVGQYEAAVCATEEALHLRRKLAETNSFIITELASSLHNLGFQLGQTGQYEAAACAEEEAVHLRRELAETDPSITKDLAWSLYNLGLDLRRIGRHQDALPTDAEAVEIFRQRADSEADQAVKDDLVYLLESYALNLKAVGRHKEAASTIQEAFENHSRPLHTVESELHLANILTTWAIYLRAVERQEDSIQIHERGAEIYGRLSETDPESTADFLCDLAADFSTTGLHEDAVCAAEKAVELYRTLTPTKPVFMEDLIETLGYLAKSLRALGCEEDAACAEAEAVTL
ncbi:hypothetical protein DFH06DRAFT_1363117, partial [Mycena polygramma]